MTENTLPVQLPSPRNCPFVQARSGSGGVVADQAGSGQDSSFPSVLMGVASADSASHGTRGSVAVAERQSSGDEKSSDSDVTDSTADSSTSMAEALASPLFPVMNVPMRVPDNSSCQSLLGNGDSGGGVSAIAAVGSALSEVSGFGNSSTPIAATANTQGSAGANAIDGGSQTLGATGADGGDAQNGNGPGATGAIQNPSSATEVSAQSSAQSATTTQMDKTITSALASVQSDVVSSVSAKEARNNALATEKSTPKNGRKADATYGDFLAEWRVDGKDVADTVSVDQTNLEQQNAGGSDADKSADTAQSLSQASVPFTDLDGAVSKLNESGGEATQSGAVTGQDEGNQRSVSSESKLVNLREASVVSQDDNASTTSSTTNASVFQGLSSNGHSPAVNGELPAQSSPVAQLKTEEVFTQIVKQAHMLNVDGHTEVKMQLEPPALGRLDLRVTSNHQLVTVQVHAESSEVRDLVQANLAQLQTALQDQGIKVDKLQVYYGANTFGFNGDGRGQRPTTDGSTKQISAIGEEDGVSEIQDGDTIGLVWNRSGQYTVDYLV